MTGSGDIDGVIAEIREPQLAEQQAAIGVRIGAHAAAALRGKLRQLGPEVTAVVEEFRWTVALHPFFQNAHVSRVGLHLVDRHLGARQ